MPEVKAPGTLIEVSTPQRDSSRAYCKAIELIPAFAAKYKIRRVPLAKLEEEIQTSRPCF